MTRRQRLQLARQTILNLTDAYAALEAAHAVALASGLEVHASGQEPVADAIAVEMGRLAALIGRLVAAHGLHDWFDSSPRQNPAYQQAITR